nr:hypothetical protein [Tanacetum cinerariifolium]
MSLRVFDGKGISQNFYYPYTPEQNDIQAYLISEDELAWECNEEEVYVAGDNMEKDTQADVEEHQSLSPNKDKPKPSHTPETQVSDSDSSSLDLKKYDNTLPLTKRQLFKYLRKVSRVIFKIITKEQWAHHEEVVVSYVDLKACIEGYYEENVDHMDQTDKVIDATMNSLDKNSIAMGDLLNAFNGVTKTLKAIQDAIKEELILKKKADIKSDISSIRQDTLEIKSMMTEIYQAFKGQSTPSSSVPQPAVVSPVGKQMLGENVIHVATKEPPSHTEGETEDT